MLGAIAGDIIGSVYEGKVGWQSAQTPDFKPLFHPLSRFTDDTVLTIACIAGGIAQAFYGEIPAAIRDQSLARLDDRLRSIVEEFEVRYPSLPLASFPTTGHRGKTCDDPEV